MTSIPLLLLLACDASVDSGASDCPPGSHMGSAGDCVLDDDTGSTGGALDIEGGPEAPEWTAEETLARLASALDAGMVHSPTVMRSYEKYMVNREGTCPSFEDPGSTEVTGVWQTDDCTTSEGWRFQGLGIYSSLCDDGQDPDTQNYGVGMREGGMLAQFTLTNPDGQVYEGGGATTHGCRWYDDGSGWCTDQTGGSFHDQDGDGWIADRTEASLLVDHTWGGDAGRRTTLVGGVGYATLDLFFENVVMDWDGCGGGPTGVLRLRDPTGYWHSLQLDDDCSGCGQLSWRGIDEGRHCVDLQGPIDAMVTEWEQPCWE